METLLQGVNQPVQPGSDISQNNSGSTLTTDSTGSKYNFEPWYEKGFWAWLQSVSGMNFYKNILSSIINDPSAFPEEHKASNFFEYLYKSPFTGYNALDHEYKKFSKSSVGGVINDLVGNDSPFSNDDNPLNDLPDELFDIFKQGLDLFNQNKVDQMHFNQAEADKNRAWQEYMSNTAYQRAMLDLKKAGINPLLAFGSLGPASTPSGDSASASLANSNSLFGSMASSVLGDKKLMVSLLTALLGIFRIFTGSYTVK